MEHHFNVDVAVKYGIAEAVLLHNLWHWVKHNEANEINHYDGHYWTYNSVKAFGKWFPYLSSKQIRTILKRLTDEGILLTGSFNKAAFDRTTWYSFTKKGINLMETSNCPTGQMELPTGANGVAQEGKPIPNNKHIYKNTDNKTLIYSAEFENLWAMYPRKQGKKEALAKYEKARANGTTYEEVEKGIRAYVEYIVANQKEEYTKMGSTFFSQESWQDDWSYRKERGNECVGQVHDRRVNQDSRGLAGTTDRSGSGTKGVGLKFPKVAYDFSQEE